MNVVKWLTSRFSRRGKALSSYRRGMARAKKRDYQGALDDYTTTLGMSETPGDVKAMAHYNRALVHSATGDHSKATEDLKAVLAMANAPVDIRTEARRKLVRMQRQPQAGDI